jgi:transcriptional regulator with XRE-family HTH domain
MARTQGTETFLRPLPTTGPAAQLRRLRLERGWGVPQLAKLADVGDATIRDLETTRSAGMPMTWARLAAALGVSEKELTG